MTRDRRFTPNDDNEGTVSLKCNIQQLQLVLVRPGVQTGLGDPRVLGLQEGRVDLVPLGFLPGLGFRVVLPKQKIIMRCSTL